MDVAKTTALLKRKQPQPTLTSPVTRKKQPQPTLTSPVTREKQPQPTLTSPVIRKKQPRRTLTSPVTRKKQPQLTLTSPVTRETQPQQTLISPLTRKKQPQPTLTSPVTRKKQPQQTLTSLHLPFDLVEGILCRLPVKQLIQFCSVCKSWNSLISTDSNFAKKQLLLSTSRQDRLHLITNFRHDSPEFITCHSPISSIFSSRSPTQFSYPLKEILNKKDYCVETSTWDGILCFGIESKDESFVLLCNPSIRKLKILPALKSPLHVSYTLVYDRFINNYKIIALNITSRSKIEFSVHTLGTDYWRRILDFPAPLLCATPGIFVSDSLNWVTCDGGFASFIVSLNFEKESCQKLSLPACDVQFITYVLTLGTLRDCLSLFVDGKDKFSDIWIMKEYGNEKSWIKLFCVPHIRELGFYHYTRALYVSKDDRVLIEFFKNKKFNLGVYDCINNTFRIPKFQYNIHGEMIPEVYVESLISPL